MGVGCRLITHETHPGRVIAAIIDALREAPEAGCVFCITWQAFVDLPFFPKRKGWQIIVDEIPQLDQFYALKIPYNQRFLADWVELGERLNTSVAFLTPQNSVKLKSFLNRRRDDVHALFRPLLKDVLSSNKNVFVDINSYTRIIEKGRICKNDDGNTVYFVSLLNPRFLDGAIMLGANFEDSLLYHWFKRFYGVKFVECAEISKHLRPVNPRTREIEIAYLLADPYFSKRKAKEEISRGVTLSDLMDKEALSFFSGQKFLYVTNNDRKSKHIDGAPNAIRMQVYSHGLNCYDSYDNIYFCPALIRQPKHLKMLRDLGFGSSHIHSATAHETCYQGVMRTSLRRNDATRTVRILVPDRNTAERIAELLRVPEVTKTGTLRSNKQQPLTGTERNQRSRARKMRQSRFAPKPLRNSFINENRHQNGAEADGAGRGANSRSYLVAFHDSKYAKRACDFNVNEYTHQTFIAEMRRESKNPLSNKDERTYFNPATFDPSIDPKSGYRTQANFVATSMLVLDIDDGILSPERFAEIFWSKAGRAQKYSFIICNSFSRSPEKPNRFRAMMLFKKPARSLLEFEAVLGSIVSRLESSGFPPGKSGLDDNCKSGVQSFFLPCTNRAHPDHRFFRTYGTKTREIERYGIDPSTYFKTAAPKKKMERAARSSIIVEEIPQSLSPELEIIRSELKRMREGRHALFFKYACRLAKHFKGNRSTVSMYLNDVAGSDRKLQAWVKPALRSLEGYRRIRS
jgi:hypothetical protein